MKKQITTYSFDASARTITFSDYGSIRLDSVLLITNVTDNIIIYNFADTSKGGSADTNILTLEYNTATMDDTDKLMIYYDNPEYSYIQSDEDATYKYYGYASSDGWQIKRKTLATGVWKVAVGTGDYDTAWADRASKTYSYTGKQSESSGIGFAIIGSTFQVA
jgi:hypothetical protein